MKLMKLIKFHHLLIKVTTDTAGSFCAVIMVYNNNNNSSSNNNNTESASDVEFGFLEYYPRGAAHLRRGGRGGVVGLFDFERGCLEMR